MIAPGTVLANAKEKSHDTEPIGASDDYRRLGHMMCRLALEIPVSKFSVGDLLKLKTGSIVETAYHQSSDLPLYVNGQLVGWTEFEVVGEQLAVRLTDLS